jgi:hypothetical protein
MIAFFISAALSLMILLNSCMSSNSIGLFSFSHALKNAEYTQPEIIPNVASSTELISGE